MYQLDIESLLMRWVQRPTSWGWSEVHAAGSTVSKVLTIPWMILNPVTLAVMKAREAAASAIVEMCPTAITEVIVML